MNFLDVSECAVSLAQAGPQCCVSDPGGVGAAAGGDGARRGGAGPAGG